MKNYSTLKFCAVLFTVFIFVLSTEYVIAQDRDIYEISSNTISAKTANNKTDLNDRQAFYKLAFNLGTTVYLENNSEQNIYGKGLISKISMEDINSFEFLKSNINKYKSAKLIVIKVNSIDELNNTIDLTTLTGMSDLKYVYIKCSFKCQKQDVENFVKVNPSVRVFYNADKPS